MLQCFKNTLHCFNNLCMSSCSRGHLCCAAVPWPHRERPVMWGLLMIHYNGDILVVSGRHAWFATRHWKCARSNAVWTSSVDTSRIVDEVFNENLISVGRICSLNWVSTDLFLVNDKVIKKACEPADTSFIIDERVLIPCKTRQTWQSFASIQFC